MANSDIVEINKTPEQAVQLEPVKSSVGSNQSSPNSFNVASEVGSQQNTSMASIETAEGAKSADPITDAVNTEKVAQKAKEEAQKVTDDASGVSVKYGTQSEKKVNETVQAAQDNANAVGAVADKEWDAEVIRSGSHYQNFMNMMKNGTIPEDKITALISNYDKLIEQNGTLTDEQKAGLQYLYDCRDGKFAYGAKGSVDEQNIGTTQVPVNTPNIVNTNTQPTETAEANTEVVKTDAPKTREEKKPSTPLDTLIEKVNSFDKVDWVGRLQKDPTFVNNLYVGLMHDSETDKETPIVYSVRQSENGTLKSYEGDHVQAMDKAISSGNYVPFDTEDDANSFINGMREKLTTPTRKRGGARVTQQVQPLVESATTEEPQPYDKQKKYRYGERMVYKGTVQELKKGDDGKAYWGVIGQQPQPQPVEEPEPEPAPTPTPATATKQTTPVPEPVLTEAEVEAEKNKGNDNVNQKKEDGEKEETIKYTDANGNDVEVSDDIKSEVEKDFKSSYTNNEGITAAQDISKRWKDVYVTIDGKKVKQRMPIYSDWTPTGSNGELDKMSADAKAELDKAQQDAMDEYNSAMSKISDDTLTFSEKADALQKMAEADETIRKYSDPSYQKGLKARKIVAMLADAMSSLGNLYATTRGAVNMKIDSASDKVAKDELAKDAMVQKRIDYWTKRLTDARNSDVRSAMLLRNSKMKEINNVLTLKQRNALRKFQMDKETLAQKYKQQSDADKFGMRLVEMHNKNVEKFEEEMNKRNFQYALERFKQREAMSRAMVAAEASKYRADKMVEAASVKASSYGGDDLKVNR